MTVVVRFFFFFKKVPACLWSHFIFKILIIFTPPLTPSKIHLCSLPTQPSVLLHRQPSSPICAAQILLGVVPPP